MPTLSRGQRISGDVVHETFVVFEFAVEQRGVVAAQQLPQHFQARGLGRTEIRDGKSQPEIDLVPFAGDHGQLRFGLDGQGDRVCGLHSTCVWHSRRT